MWQAVEDDVARAEHEVSWHWAWDHGPTDGTLRQFAWEFELAESLTAARLTLAAQKGLPGVWLDGQLLHASQDGMVGRELQGLDLGALKAGKHRLTADLRRLRSFVKEPRQGGIEAIVRGRYPFGSASSRLWAQLEMALTDGSSPMLTIDLDRSAAPAPVLFSENYHGETYDALLEPAGWASPFDVTNKVCSGLI